MKIRRNEKGLDMIKRISMIALGALLCTFASAQSLDERVRELERRVEQLEKQQAPSTTSSVAPKPTTGQTDGWKKKENWRTLKQGMSDNDVRALLGEPDKVNTFSTFKVWLYPDYGQVQFDNRSVVEGWAEPR
jgi:outer membrane protein assembly factor BamE (lipoprotein component of BamABCDE complex)